MKFSSRQIGAALSVIWVIVALTLPTDALTPEGHRMLAIFGVAVILWVTEAIPLYATAVVIILSEIVLVSNEAIVPLSEGYDAPAYSSFYAALASPVLMLFLGGFMLADAAAKFQLDRNLAGVLLAPFKKSPATLVGGLMLITALLSMFMSNTATTASMMAVVIPVAARLAPGDPLRTGLPLAVPVAANIGGFGTPVGTPPNAIALGQLAEKGIRIDFMNWMMLAVPVVVVILAVAWLVIVKAYPAATKTIELSIGGAFDRSRPAKILYATFIVTVGLWFTEPLHGIPSAVVGFIPVVILLATGVMNSDDLKRLNWHVLWLVGGGIALGSGVASTGLDDWLVGLIKWGAMPSLILLMAMALFALVLSTLISHSAAANLMIPIGVSVATAAAVSVDPSLIAVVIAAACSLAMILPVSTPPNAIAYATGLVHTRDLARIGVVVGVVGSVLIVGIAPRLWDALGLLP